MDIVDLHCDLLGYLALSPDRTPQDPAPGCSIPQLQEGGVTTQVTAIYTDTDRTSLLCGLKQIECFKNLRKLYRNNLKNRKFDKEAAQNFSPERAVIAKGQGASEDKNSEQKQTQSKTDSSSCFGIGAPKFIPAFENASSFCLESEPLSTVLKRLDHILTQISPLYIGLTWNGENRFGGGIGADAGLKEDGKELLRYLSGKGIAIDLSHASDSLSHGIFNCIDQESLSLRVMASHCNFRAVQDHPRNLPDEIAKEVFKRGGVMGLVFFSLFLKSPDQLLEHIEHGLSLGGENALAFGADFFSQLDVPKAWHDEGFHPEMSNASCYPHALDMLKQSGTLSKSQIEKIASKNAMGFIASQMKD